MYCMDLAKQLMPDIVSVITYELKRIQHGAILDATILFEHLKRGLNESISNSKIDDPYKNTLKEKLGKISLGLISRGDHSTARTNYQTVRLMEDDYQENVVESLRNYRRIIYSLAGTNATPATL